MINEKNAAKYVSQASDKLYDAYEVARWNKIENQYQIIEGHLVGVESRTMTRLWIVFQPTSPVWVLAL